MIFLLKYWKAIAAGIGLVAIAYSYIYTYQSGKQSVYDKLQSERVKILKDGKQIDENVLRADDSTLCDLLGGCSVSDESESN